MICISYQNNARCWRFKTIFFDPMKELMSCKVEVFSPSEVNTMAGSMIQNVTMPLMSISRCTRKQDSAQGLAFKRISTHVSWVLWCCNSILGLEISATTPEDQLSCEESWCNREFLHRLVSSH